MFVDNGRVIGNLIFSGVLERFPKLKVCLVESGLGWIPFYLEALDYQLVENAPKETSFMTMKPSEYFKRNFFASFWFETNLGRGLADIVEALGEDNIMFETDFPHPTCLYPEPLEFLQKSLRGIDKSVQRKLLQDNAARVYNIDLS
ncbi:MAG: amidohydrolase [Hahellaceae bacterium]|nr:amidohydrolase [Hahellaceae bacterium]